MKRTRAAAGAITYALRMARPSRPSSLLGALSRLFGLTRFIAELGVLSSAVLSLSLFVPRPDVDLWKFASLLERPAQRTRHRALQLGLPVMQAQLRRFP